MLSEDEWFLIADRIWAGPGRWLGRSALPMRGPVAIGADPIRVEELPSGARTLHTEDQVLPGLHDAHVHSGLVDLPAVRRGGIASVTDLGGVPAQLAQLRRLSLIPSSDLPALEIAGAFLTAPGGYPSDRSWAAPGSWREVRSAGDAQVAVAEQTGAGAELVKVAINVEAGPVLAPPVLAAIVAAAHAAGLLVVAHTEGAGAVPTALAAGVDVLAHVPWTERLEAGVVRECAEQTTWISTLHLHQPRGGGAAWDAAGANLIGFLGLGGTVRYGTDLGNGPMPLGVNTEETLALQTLGLSTDDLLSAMTGPLAAAPTGMLAAASTGPLAAAPTGRGGSMGSRFVAGVAPCVLTDPITRDQPVAGPKLRQAQVFSLQHLHDLERAR
jgi:hypothetical protein